VKKSLTIVLPVLAVCIGIGLLIGYLASRSRPTAPAPGPIATSPPQPISPDPMPAAPEPVRAHRESPRPPNPASNTAPIPSIAASDQNHAPIPKDDFEAITLAGEERIELRAPAYPLFSYAYEHARNGDLETMQKILDAHPEFITNTAGSYQATLLHNAAYRGQREIVADLLNRNPNLNALTSAGHTPLYDAVAGGNKEVVQMLLEHGADMNIPDANGLTPLQYASQRDRPDIALLLKNWPGKP